MSAFRIRTVLTKTAALIKATFGSVGLFIIGANLIMLAVQFTFVRPLMTGMTTGVGAPFALFTSPGYWLAMLIGLAVFSVMLAGATHALLIAGKGQRPDIGDCVRGGMAMALPVLGLSVLWGLGVWLGFILLMVPGLIVMTMWCLCIPILVAGEAGVIGSFGRSRALTKGSRLKIFALLLLVLLLYYIVAFALLGGVMMNGATMQTAAAASLSSVAMVGSMIVNTAFMLLLPALLVATYLEAQRVMLGVDAGDVAEVFA